VPLNSHSSRVVQVMLNGSMPPSASGLPPVTEADIETVAQYIDNPLFWPNVPLAEAPDASAPLPPSPAPDGGTAPAILDLHAVDLSIRVAEQPRCGYGQRLTGACS
jgi:hypothetical protein